MEKYFATFALVFSSLAVGFTELDVTVESVDNHSPFSEQTDGDWENGNRLFTKEELANYNGEDPSLPIYLAIKGIVFDVSEAKRVYGPGGKYHGFAGKDASRAMAKWSTEEEDLNDDLDGLTEEELARLDDSYNKLFATKYPKVGYLDEDNFTVRKNNDYVEL